MKKLFEKATIINSMRWKVVKHEIDGILETVMALAPTKFDAEIIACRLSVSEKDVFYTVEML